MNLELLIVSVGHHYQIQCFSASQAGLLLETAFSRILLPYLNTAYIPHQLEM